MDESYDPDELVRRAEVARRLRVEPRTVTIWSQRPLGFPDQVERGLWRWGAVAEWDAGRVGVVRPADDAVASPSTLSPADVTRLRRELVAVVRRLARCELDRARLVELFVTLHDQAGMGWQELGDIAGMGSHAVRKAVGRSRPSP